MKYELDTNCLLRWLLGDLPKQAKMVETILEKQVYVSDAVLNELSWILSKFYDFDDITVGELIETAINHPNISCNAKLYKKVINDYVKSPKASFIDVYLAHSANDRNRKLLTFDKTIAKKLPKLAELV
jgi:predicted nucleic-acid-binding protein